MYQTNSEINYFTIFGIIWLIGYANAQTCSFPGSPAHSTVDFSEESLESGTIATYTCERGFELLGPARRVCDNGQWVPDGIPFCVLNVAAGKAPMQISTDGVGIPQKAIDGSTSAFYTPDTCSLTKAERVPWWYVNLLEPYMVQLVRLDFGKSCCGVPIRYERIPELYGKLFAGGVALIVLYAIMRRMPNATKMGGENFFRMGKAKITIINPQTGGKGVYFKDVAGMQEAKQEVMEFVNYLKRPEKYQSLGARVPKGALLTGPPGTGKTLLAKAVATEARVPFLTMNGSEFIEMIGGLGAARVRDLFKQAKQKAPCIIYIDEIDAVGRQRSNTTSSSSGESEQTLNQLLVEMDGMASKEGILMLASTNRVDILDKALLRPGRFDRLITIDLPTLQERKEIFERHLSVITLEKEPSAYSHRLAILSPGFSGADIANVCNEAARHAARDNKKKVTESDLEYAVERSVGGTEKRTNSLNEEERRTVAYHESGHALVGWLLEYSDVLQKVTIVPRTNLALGFAQYTPHDQKLFTREQLVDKICMALGGRAAENITFARITTGAQNDLEKVTKMAFHMVAKYGMSKNIGPMYVPDEDEVKSQYVDEKPYSKALQQLIDVESKKIIQEAYFRAEDILKTNRDKLVTLAEALLKQETLNYDEVVNLIGPPKYDSAKRRVDPTDFEQSLKTLSNSSEKSDSAGKNETQTSK